MGIKTRSSKSMQLHASGDRGKTELDWLKSRHSFSFGEYYDPKNMGFRSLLVINDDLVEPGGGFGMHPHKDMEIITYVIEGELEHKDSLGNGSIIPAGDVQKMSAGTGIMHSEFNPSKKNRVHLLQIWIVPDTKGLTPSYEQISLKEKKMDGLIRIGSRQAKPGVVSIHQDAELFYGRFLDGRKEALSLLPTRGVWIQLIKGTLDVNGVALGEGDGLAVTNNIGLALEAKPEAQFLLFDLG